MSYEISTVRFSEYQDTNFLCLQLNVHGDDGEGTSSDSHEAHHTFGFASRPDDPDAEGVGCQAFIMWDGDEGHVTPSYDPRYIDKVPVLKKGGSAQYCKTGSFNLLDGDSGTATLYVPYGNKAHVFSLDTQTEAISLIHSNGCALTIDQAGNFTLKNKSGDACIILNDAGITINGNLTVNGTLSAGPQFLALLTLLGANTKPPTPVPPFVNLTA